MLFMVIECFAKSGIATVGERFNCLGRMLPDGVLSSADCWSKRQPTARQSPR